MTNNDAQPDDLVPEETEQPVEHEIVDDFEGIEIDQLLPTMNVSASDMVPEKEECIVSDSDILGLYEEILDNARDDRKNLDEVLANFVNMVMNDGDSSSASKEAIVNLWKIKTDIGDKMAKIADLKTRIKLKEKDTFPRYLAAQQNNKVIIESSKRDMIKSVQKLVEKKKHDK